MFSNTYYGKEILTFNFFRFYVHCERMQYILKRLLLPIILCFNLQGFSQSCTLSTDANVICANSALTFTATNTPSGNVVSYKFDFGDTKTDSTNSNQTAHPYNTPGTYPTKVTVYLVGGTTCTAIGPTIKVNPLPNCDFVITSPDTVCYRNNQICILDLSTPGAASAAITKRYFQYSDGGSVDETAPFSPTICYHATFPLGFLYSLKMEITDANGCVSYLEKKDSIYLAPATIPPSFRFIDSMRCSNTLATFTNTSLRPQSDYRSFQWVFGDGQFNTTTWTNLKHIYTPPGSVPNLYTIDRFGCKDTAVKNPGDTIRFIVVDPNLNLTTATTQCYKNNVTRFVNYSQNYKSKIYSIFDNNTNQKIYTFNRDSFIVFTSCGVYRLNLKVTFQDTSCNVNRDTLIYINGPKAIIRNDTIRPINATQCEAHDTVRIISPNPYLSCHSGNTGMKWFWDFSDAFAPPCTTDTKHNVNVGLNCRYSLDSIEIKHFYSKDGCYGARLTMTDTISGCTSSDSVTFALKQPDAGWDSSSVPIRRGLFNNQPQRYICPNTSVEFYFSELLPECGYERIWLNFDSACGANNWQLMDTVNPQPSTGHVYTDVCDSLTGWITVGVIVKNGLDKNGNECYDTAWYHHMLHLDQLKADFGFTVRPRIGCGPYTVDFKLLDTIQRGLEYVFWDFDIYSPSMVDDTVFQYMNGDSVIKRQTWAYSKPGYYTALVSLKSTHPESPSSHCFASFRQDIALGLAAEAGVFSETHCVNDTFRLYAFVRYQNSNKDYWRDTARANANKERLWWNIDDGKGYFYQGAEPVVSFKKPGNYRIRLIAQDSLGCKDTFSLFGQSFIPLNIIISELKAKIASTPLIYYCQPQIIQFKDSSYFADSFGVAIKPDPFLIDTTYWEFDDNKPSSYFKNPAHNFTANGIFNIKLVSVASAVGCRDTDVVQIQIKGPEPKFVIASDTQGCAPLTVQFTNTTPSPIQTWVWEFGDPASTTKTDGTGANMTFTYTIPGVYDIKLLGIDQVFNPSTGNTKTCTGYFPDTITHLPTRRVYVLPSPALDIVMNDSICPGQEILFKVNSDTLYKTFAWDFGDGNTGNIARPDTSIAHTYTTSGIYKVIVVPSTSASIQCIDTADKSVHVQSVQADFDMDAKKSPMYSFINKSSANAVRWVWDFGQPSTGADNQSTAKNPQHNFGAELGDFIICLSAFTSEDCWDSACKMITRDTAYITIPNVFTPDNNDGFNDAFDISIEGYTEYNLVIYNRWGGKVFSSKKDGVGNDGNNWNGKEDNEGVTCPGGVYYFIFKYKLITETDAKTVTGTITLLRE